MTSTEDHDADPALATGPAVSCGGHPTTRALPAAGPAALGDTPFVSLFVTVNLGVLAATVAGIQAFATWPRNLIILAGPISSALIAGIAKRTVRRQDVHVRELVIVIARLEQYVGLDVLSPRRRGTEATSWWPDDEAFLPPPWIRYRSQDSSSQGFLDVKRLGSTSRNSVAMFTIVQVMSAWLAIGVVVSPLAG